ncbi:kelch-like protein 10 [Zootermopsis nevadensis]|uniref:Kelch-like protein 10 n=1 Tax=Zootermopsis nevadensis TaxID=136037 RepID=A0A067QEB6_ZOONE|nr:kelch-like protein 10 [Zootermopsis nevadensis]KDQ71532.1 Kelch-like protein 10 [Zootermopsis nevadensis]
MTVEVYDPVTNRWTFVAPMLCGRRNHCCVAFHGSLYVLGGDNSTYNKLITEKYDPAEDTWTEIPHINYHSTCLKAEVIDKLIVICDYFDGIKIYNEEENTWYQATESNVYRFGMSICVVNNLPNAKDYVYKHRDKLVKGKRKKIVGLGNPVAASILLQRQF